MQNLNFLPDEPGAGEKGSCRLEGVTAMRCCSCMRSQNGCEAARIGRSSK